jgi:hypothetical protein
MHTDRGSPVVAADWVFITLILQHRPPAITRDPQILAPLFVFQCRTHLRFGDSDLFYSWIFALSPDSPPRLQGNPVFMAAAVLPVNPLHPTHHLLNPPLYASVVSCLFHCCITFFPELFYLSPARVAHITLVSRFSSSQPPMPFMIYYTCIPVLLAKYFNRRQGRLCVQLSQWSRAGHVIGFRPAPSFRSASDGHVTCILPLHRQLAPEVQCIHQTGVQSAGHHVQSRTHPTRHMVFLKIPSSSTATVHQFHPLATYASSVPCKFTDMIQVNIQVILEYLSSKSTWITRAYMTPKVCPLFELREVVLRLNPFTRPLFTSSNLPPSPSVASVCE